jgi:hypothetical protein
MHLAMAVTPQITPRVDRPDKRARRVAPVLENVRFSAPNASTRFANEASDRDVSKMVSGIKVPSNVVSDTVLRGVATKLHTGDVLRGCQHRSAPLRKEGVS